MEQQPLQQPQSDAHLKQQPQPSPNFKPEPRTAKKQQNTLKNFVVATALTLALGVGGYFTFSPGASTDQPTQSQIAEMQASWEVAKQTGIQLAAVEPEEQKEALQQLPIPEQEKQALQSELDAGRSSLVWVTVWDNMAQDGDVISLQSDGLTVTVPILLEPQRIAMVRPSQGVINLTGVTDGGGGITLGLMSGPDQVLLPPLGVGQQIGIPVR